mmetsp:Transcript_10788/g.28854  ORF Transcript_10788/g.28854 Transcript_10788/m.28854 type:complete len:299 (-) Transcript_10788:426-1322(-)
MVDPAKGLPEARASHEAALGEDVGEEVVAAAHAGAHHLYEPLPGDAPLGGDVLYDGLAGPALPGAPEDAREIRSVDEAVLALVQDTEGDLEQRLVSQLLHRERDGHKPQVAEVAVAVQIHRLEDVVQVLRDRNAAVLEVLLQHGDGQLPVAVTVQHAEGEVLRLAAAADVRHGEAGRALQQGLLRHGAEDLRQAALHCDGLPVGRLHEPLRVVDLLVVGGLVELVVQGLLHGRPPVAVVRQHLGEEVLRVGRQVERLRGVAQPISERGSHLDLALERGARHVRQERLAGEHDEQNHAA